LDSSLEGQNWPTNPYPLPSHARILQGSRYLSQSPRSSIGLGVLADFRRLISRPRMTRIRSNLMRRIGSYANSCLHNSYRGLNAGFNNPRPLRLGCCVPSNLTSRGSNAGRQTPRPLRHDTHTGSHHPPSSGRPRRFSSSCRTSSGGPRWFPLGPPTPEHESSTFTIHSIQISIGSWTSTKSIHLQDRTLRSPRG